jgi:hypothetical protein
VIRIFSAAFGIVLASVATAESQPAPPSATVAPFSSLAVNSDTSIDGSTIALRPVRGGLSRQIVSSGGAVKQSIFALLSDRLGTVSEEGAVVGLFMLEGRTIATEYSDGRSETLVVESGRVSMMTKDGGGQISCASWYPAGHHFNTAERKAALAQYARRLGVDDPRYGAPAQLKNDCGPALKVTRLASANDTGPGAKISDDGSDTLNMIMGQVLALYRRAPAVAFPAVATAEDRGSFDQPAWEGFDRFYSRFLAGHEGGYVENDGNGSPANFGINQGANPDVDVGNLTQADAEQILYQRYWLASGADRLPPALALVHGDTAINLGVRTATELLAQSGGDPNAYLDLREAKYRAIAAPSPDKAKYLYIWLARNEDLRNLIRSGEGDASFDREPDSLPAL